MDIRRFWRHLLMSPTRERLAFPRATLDRIQKAVAECEAGHRGQVMLVVEAELTSAQLWHELSSRERARQVFALQGVWNTEENNGVLVYLLLADRRVEIVADRGIEARVERSEWEAICRMMEGHFRNGRFEEGALAGVRAVAELLTRHFPARSTGRNELPDRPILI
jgi:uncharacterized membrane protein